MVRRKPAVVSSSQSGSKYKLYLVSKRLFSRFFTAYCVYRVHYSRSKNVAKPLIPTQISEMAELIERYFTAENAGEVEATCCVDGTTYA